MKKESKIIGWQITADEFKILNEILTNYRYRSLSQVLYDLMYVSSDINELLENSKVFAAKQMKNNLKAV